MTHQLRAIGQQIRDQELNWSRGNRKQAIAGISMIHMSLAALAHNGALAAALERLILQDLADSRTLRHARAPSPRCPTNITP